jgi:hypothetical protein
MRCLASSPRSRTTRTRLIGSEYEYDNTDHESEPQTTAKPLRIPAAICLVRQASVMRYSRDKVCGVGRKPAPL